MKKKHASELYASLSASSVESNSSDFETLSLRISHRTAAMIQALNVAFWQPEHKALLTRFTDGISQQLAESLLGSVDNEPIIVEEASNGAQPDSALDLLVGAGAIKYDDARLRRIRSVFQEGE
ncbi:hypothetical protein [Luteimonas sp. MC1825]|uniref:hypothetical protein n=1 Tax=Luteimonas sp. MC1825 TaxID=2761107 RepID=UPI00160E1259|nr:hypothetical protein [Luteimonas sp. MC1825]MBB6600323.1 hypothetical protein [Luteimonas sp. MC1825]QOC88001.1 hypothetical protein IDM46_12400 [Luteimonas sp. MC1825]